MSFNPDEFSHNLMQQISDLMDQKMQQLKEELKQEVASSIQELRNSLSAEPHVKKGKRFDDLPDELVIQMCSHLNLTDISSLKQTQKRICSVINRYNLDKPIFEKLIFYLVKTNEGFLKIKVDMFGKKISCQTWIQREGEAPDEFRQIKLIEMLSEIRLVKVIQLYGMDLDHTVAKVIIQNQKKGANWQILFDWDWISKIQLTADEFLKFGQQMRRRIEVTSRLPHDFLNDEFMGEIIKMHHVIINCFNQCRIDKYETGLTNRTLELLSEITFHKTSFDVAYHHTSFTVKCIRKIIQKCVMNNITSLYWRLGQLKEDQQKMTDFLMQEINESPNHPYKVDTHIGCLCCGEGTSYRVVNRDSNSKGFHISFQIRPSPG